MNIGKNTIGGELLRSFVERVEAINEQIKQLGKDKSVVMAEAKAANGMGGKVAPLSGARP